LFGFDTAVISGTLTALKAQFTLGAAMEGWLVSSALLGCAMGAIVAGSLADRFGRKLVLIISGLLFVICSIGCTLAWNLDVLIWSRLVGGLGVGLASMVSPLYISEVSPSNLRGRMVTLFQFAITIGIRQRGRSWDGVLPERFYRSGMARHVRDGVDSCHSVYRVLLHGA
jgi:SP family arabinose:H+ symporter-like MFS transporter